MLAAVKEDEAIPQFRKAREDDRFLISKDVEVNLPEFTSRCGVQFNEITMRMLWSVRSKDIHVELTDANVRYILAALGASDKEERKEKVVPKGEDGEAPRSPKRRRRLKRRKSQEEGACPHADVHQEPDESRGPA